MNSKRYIGLESPDILEYEHDWSHAWDMKKVI